MKKSEKILICTLLNALLPAYSETGETIEGYYNNVILPDLTADEYKTLEKIAGSIW